MNKKITITLDTDEFLYFKGAYEEYMSQPNHMKPCGFGKYVWFHIMDNFVDRDSYYDDKANYVNEHLDEILEKYPEVQEDEDFAEMYLD